MILNGYAFHTRTLKIVYTSLVYKTDTTTSANERNGPIGIIVFHFSAIGTR